MRVCMLLAGAAIGLGSLSAEAQANCNARGEFCGYPTWAANAFSGPTGRKPRYASGYESPDVGAYGYAPTYGYTPAYAPAYGYGPGYGYAAPINPPRLYRRRDWR
jgi:hypothetical protein